MSGLVPQCYVKIYTPIGEYYFLDLPDIYLKVGIDSTTR